MSLTTTIRALDQLGTSLRQMTPAQFTDLSRRMSNENPWFTADNVQLAITGLTNYLDADKLQRLMEPYRLPHHEKKIGIVMAGNIPAVGFHDLLCTLLSGHIALLKLSSKDQVLIRFLTDRLIAYAPELASRIVIADRLNDVDAIIATGSNNSARYFHQYFGKYPNIIRKNRTSVAILSGEENTADLKNLGRDIFTYFGLGCRNVSKLYVPENYRLSRLLDALEPFSEVMHHHKYHNNYDYHKSILLVNGDEHLDNGFLLLQENEELVSPISVLYYQRYVSEASLRQTLEQHRDNIQCVVSDGGWFQGSVAMGQAQMPDPWDYADGVDTMAFLCDLD